MQQLPVVSLFLIVFGVVETVHLDFGGEVTGEDLGEEETIVERSLWVG